MNVTEAIKQRRSIRKFLQTPVEESDLNKIVDAARYAAFGGNLQPLKYSVITGDTAKAVFAHTKWAGYLPDWNPTPEESPTAYIGIFGDTSIKQNFEVDAGAAIQNMCLAATDLGLATCWLGAIDREAIEKLLGTNIPLLYLLGVGYADQKSHVVPINGKDIKYYEDENGEICVPKRSIEDVLI